MTPRFAVIVQGTKRFLFGDEPRDYGEADYVVTTAAVPAIAHVTAASRRVPYLSLMIDLDRTRLAALASEVSRAQSPTRFGSSRNTPRTPCAGPTQTWPDLWIALEAALPRRAPERPARALDAGRLGRPLEDALLRLVRLLETPGDIPLLAPLFEREVLYRLLTDESGAGLRALAVAGADPAIERALAWLDENYAAPLRIEDLAELVHLSASSLHHRFKARTGTTPVQYQKRRRLEHARRLMLAERLDAASAAYAVGYASASQFSRDYRKAYDAPPRRDVERLRAAARGSDS
jgi:AraC-like DNA-binding protein